jgi:hypothetical protein
MGHSGEGPPVAGGVKMVLGTVLIGGDKSVETLLDQVIWLGIGNVINCRLMRGGWQGELS